MTDRRKLRGRGGCVGLFLALSTIPSRAATPRARAEAAPTTSGELAAAERSYQDIDFAGAYEHAKAALAAGHATLEDTARLEVLLGISAASLGNDADARRAFIVALGVDPKLNLDSNLSPKVRGPYLEARGFWGTYPERLRLEARLTSDAGHLTTHLVDPGHLVARIELKLRDPGAEAYESAAGDAGRPLTVPLFAVARTRGFEYFLRGLDARGNALIEVGSEDDPRTQPGVPRPAAPDRDIPTRSSDGRSYLWPAVLAVAGVGAATVGVVFHLQRESLAGEWNGASCERPGLSRIQQCGDVDSRLHRDERLAIGAYAAGGALLVGSAVWLVAFPSPSEQGSLPDHTRAGISGCGVIGTTLSCAGRF